MKAKVVRGAGFRGVLNYVFDVGSGATGEKLPENVGGNMAGRTPQELAREFGITKKLRPDCKNPVWHCSLALPEGDRLGAEKWGELARDFMLEMGLDPANFLYDVERHRDTDHDHVHIVASRIGLDGSLWHGQKDVFRAIEATQQLEKKHGLTLTPGLDLDAKKERKTLTAGEINMGVRTQTKPPRMVCQDAIDEVLRSSSVISAPEFIARLDAFGVRAVPSVASTGTMNGFSFESENVSFTGSKLGDGYKWAQLQKKGVEYDKARDFEKLAQCKRLASERAGIAQSGPVAGLSSGASERGVGALADHATGRDEEPTGVRPGIQSATAKPGSLGAGDERSGSDWDGAEGGDAGLSDKRLGGSNTRSSNEHDSDANQHSETSIASKRVIRDGEAFSEIDAERSEGINDSSSRRATAVRNDDVSVNRGVDIGRAPGRGWADRFKQASAAKRDAAKLGLRSESVEQSHGGGKKVASRDRVQAREIDPTSYLERYGFTVKREGRHLSVRDSSGDERYRVTRKEDGHYVTCDQYENGIGDNIALVMELEPGTGFADAVYMLSGAPSVATALMRAAPVPARQPPQMPHQTDDDVQRGRAYLVERGITLETIKHAEKVGMLRYSTSGVLFVGMDDQGTVQNIMRRSIDLLDPVQKRDLRGTDKRHPQVLLGNPDVVLIVEGGTDALAAVDVARRSSRPAPTIFVSGGANVRSWIETPWVQKLLKLAKKVIVAFERESTPDVQAKTDASHQVQMQRLQEVCRAQVVDWKPPQGIKDMAALNLDQVQQIEATHTKERHKNSFPAG